MSATVKGTDSSTDLAVVEVDMSKLSDSTKKNIKIATIGDSKRRKSANRQLQLAMPLAMERALRSVILVQRTVRLTPKTAQV